MILIVESGSSKSDVIIISNKEKIKFSTEGINPSLESEESIRNKIYFDKHFQKYFNQIESLFYFGAGCSSKKEKKIISNTFKLLFKNLNSIQIESDLYASALACYDNSPILSCILGTGSNSCYFDGKKIFKKTQSLGYILGDEGSGSYLGKKILQHYFYNKLPIDIKLKFKEKYKINKETLIKNVYKSSNVNLYLSSFVPFIYDNKKNIYVKKIIYECFDDFIINHILPYKNCDKIPICFVGSISYYFKEELMDRINHHSLNIGEIIQKPIDKLSEKLLLNLKKK